MKYLIPILLLCYSGLLAQLPVTIPWSATVNETFPSAAATLAPWKTDFTFTAGAPPSPGQYTIIESNNDAGHIYIGYSEINRSPHGFKMLACYNPGFTPKIIYRDTVRNICGNTKYLFWAGINNMTPQNCLKPSFTMSVETLTGTPVASFQTGIIGGPTDQDNFAWYYGYYDRRVPPPVPFYGGSFELPAGITDVVVKITTNPSSAYYQCTSTFEIDNIILMPIGPTISISSVKYPGGWVTGSCFTGNVPVELTSIIEDGYLDFGTRNYIPDQYNNPAYQWQQSLDGGYTWNDIPGENSMTISHLFSIPDTFWMRLRVSEAVSIGNNHCSNVSNIMKIEVDGIPTNFMFSTNSPVCTDGDLKLQVEGGATYQTYGPNGFYDNSPRPHRYHPSRADSGWYYSEMTTFGGCKIADSQYVKIIGPYLDTNLFRNKIICYGDTVHLESAPDGSTYLWSPAEGLSSTTIRNPVASPVRSTTYTVSIKDMNGCSASADVPVLLKNHLLKVGIDGPAVACPQENVYFRDTSNGSITSWKWSFGNGNTSFIKNPPAQHYPVTNGNTYPVSLTVTDTAGCTQTITSIIRSVNNCYIAVPNAFSPNGDGLNDFLYPLNAYKATDLLFKVYNREGMLVFSTTNWLWKWDGRANGEPQPPGVYVWMLQYTDAEKKPVFLKGTVMLIR